jgi:hypothetical protein
LLQIFIFQLCASSDVDAGAMLHFGKKKLYFSTKVMLSSNYNDLIQIQNGLKGKET